MRVLIVDDEAPARQRLRELLERLSDYLCCGEARSGLEALQLTARLQPDIVLLDIQMPGLDGLETAARLAALAQPPAVIFTTAYSEHALAAFDAQASAYLLKPVRLEQLAAALLNAARINRAQFNQLAGTATSSGMRSHLSARIGQRLELIPLADIIYFQADQKYVTVRHRYGQALVTETLRALEEELGTRLLRVHRNALALVAHMAGLEVGTDGNTTLLFHHVTDRLEVSRRYLPALRKFFKELQHPC